MASDPRNFLHQADGTPALVNPSPYFVSVKRLR
jgi:hypothetical protein